MLPRLGLGLALAMVGCHHDSTPLAKPEPGEVAPLPPSSGTPIGYLVDAAVDLHLRDDQLAKLKEIDDALAARLESYESQLRAANRPTESEAQQQPSGGRHGGGRRGGGMGGMGGGGGMASGGAMGGGGRHHRQGAGSASGSAAPRPDLARLTDQRNAEVKDSLTRAFAVLDEPQRDQARSLLAAHDVDIETGSTASPAPDERPAGGEP
jgi:hypothetical protein